MTAQGHARAARHPPLRLVTVGASVPDLPGCIATGKTLDAAMRRIGRLSEQRNGT